MTTTYHDFQTSIGTLRLVGDEDSIDRIELPNRAAEPPDPAWTPSNGALPAAGDRSANSGVLRRQRREFAPLALEGPSSALRLGGTTSHPVWRDDFLRELATRIGKPTASRAVGAANGRNGAGGRALHA